MRLEGTGRTHADGAIRALAVMTYSVRPEICSETLRSLFISCVDATVDERSRSLCVHLDVTAAVHGKEARPRMPTAYASRCCSRRSGVGRLTHP